jgi:tetratricopeptide (TPR) repeat protein
MEAGVRNAIARIEVIENQRILSRGTGFLVADGLALTALHVVADRTKELLTPYPGEIVLSFPNLRTKAVIDQNHWDRAADWALLHCEAPLSAANSPHPLAVAELREEGVEWETYGFPEAESVDGMVMRGRIANRLGTLEGSRAVQLFTEEAAAGQGARVRGLSGGPVLVRSGPRQAVVGLLRFSLMEEHFQTVAGTLYACPISSVLEKTGKLLPLPDPCFGLPGLAHQPLPAQPFRHLARFTAQEAEIFFGRNREIRQMYDGLTEQGAATVVLLYGQAGVGKSSFLDAGLLPRLQWEHQTCYLRRDPRRTLVDTLRDNLNRLGREGGGSAVSLREVWMEAEKRGGKPLVVFFDQLEEVYTHPLAECPNEWEQFAEEIERVFEPECSPRGRLVLSFRKEWFPEIQKQIEAHHLMYGKVFLEALDRAAIIEAITGLTQTERLRRFYGLTIEPELANTIASDLLADSHSPIAPTLQILLTKLWRQAASESRSAPSMTWEGYLALKKKGLLLADFLDQQLETLRVSQREWVESGLALDVLAFHTTPLRTAQERSAQELLTAYRHRAGEIPAGVQEMQNLFLLSDTSRDTEQHSTRLCHDTIAPIVRDRLEASENPGQRARRILESRIADWNEGSESGLLDEGLLKAVEAGAPGMRAPTEKEEKFVEASRKQQRKRERHRRVLYRLSAAAVLMIIASAVVAQLQATKAVHERNIASANLELAKRAVDESLSSAGRQQARDAPDAPQLEQFRQELLLKAQDFYSNFLAKPSKNDAEFRAESALVHSKLGDIDRLLGQREAAVEQYRAAVSGLEELVRENPGNAEHRRALAYAHNWLGETLMAWAEQTRNAPSLRTQAGAEYDEALRLQQQLHTEAPGNAQYQQDLARSYDNRGILRADENEAPEAESDFRQAILLLEPLAKVTPVENESPPLHDSILAYNNLSALLSRQNELPQAQELAQRAIENQRQLVKVYPDNWGYREELEVFQNNLSFLILQTGDVRRARQENDAALDSIEQLATPSPFLERQRAEAHMLYLHLEPSDHPEFHVLYQAMGDEYASLAQTYLSDGNRGAAGLAIESLRHVLPDLVEPDRTRLMKTYESLRALASEESRK